MCSVNTRVILLAAVTVARGIAGGLGALAAAGDGCGALATAERNRRQVDMLCVFVLRLLAALTGTASGAERIRARVARPVSEGARPAVHRRG